MLSVRLESSMEAQLDNLAKVTQRPKSFFVKEALKNYLNDMNDFYDAKKRSNSQDRHLINLEELEASLGI